jgi:hypothetical protein
MKTTRKVQLHQSVLKALSECEMDICGADNESTQNLRTRLQAVDRHKRDKVAAYINCITRRLQSDDCL